MRVVYFGSDEFGLPTLAMLARSGRHELVGVLSQPDRPAGRGRRLTPTPVAAWACRQSVRLLCAENVNQPAVLDALRQWAGDIGVVIAFGQKIGQPILDSFSHGCVNLHASLLPRYRGAAPAAWAILNGEEQTGVTVFRLVQKMDAGPILARRAMTVGPAVTAGEMLHRLAGLGPEIVLSCLDDIEAGRARFVPQDDSQACPAPRLTKADGAVDWGQPATVIARRIRGLYPWPSVRALFIGHAGRAEQVILVRALPDTDITEETLAAIRSVLKSAGGPGGEPVATDLGRPGQAEPGTLREDLGVVAGAGAVYLLEVKPAGGRVMSFADFARGRRIRPGDRFVNCPG